MTSFIDKFTQDINSGMWDYSWKVDGTGKVFTFIVPKHYLSGLSFSLDVDKKGDELETGMIIFPNGYGVVGKLIELKNAVNISIERTVKDSMKTYVNPSPAVVSTTEIIQSPEDKANAQIKLKSESNKSKKMKDNTK